MTAIRPTPLRATDREAGVACPHCNQDVVLHESICNCPQCGMVQHWACWQMEHGCGSYECRPERVSTVASTDLLVITDDDLSTAKPLHTRASPEEFTRIASASEANRFRATNKLAVAAFIVAVIGIPAFGIVTGIIAAVLGCIALALHRPSSQRGVGWAVGGIVLGLADFAGWLIALSLIWGAGTTDLAIDGIDIDLDPGSLVDMPDHISRAMKANAFIQVQEQWKGMFGRGIGSGVILKIENQQAMIVTNRHVIDPEFANNKRAPNDASMPTGVTLQVKLVGQAIMPGTTMWVAPHGIDMALISVPVLSTDPIAVPWENEPHLRVGDRVFAIGNPHGLGWTHTSGEVSQVRKQDFGPTEIKVLQTTAAINPGNSGGGLYDNTGRLIGINTWIHDKRVAEGLNFALSFQPLLTLAPANFNLPADHAP